MYWHAGHRHIRRFAIVCINCGGHKKPFALHGGHVRLLLVSHYSSKRFSLLSKSAGNAGCRHFVGSVLCAVSPPSPRPEESRLCDIVNDDADFTFRSRAHVVVPLRLTTRLMYLCKVLSFPVSPVEVRTLTRSSRRQICASRTLDLANDPLTKDRQLWSRLLQPFLIFVLSFACDPVPVFVAD